MIYYPRSIDVCSWVKGNQAWREWVDMVCSISVQTCQVGVVPLLLIVCRLACAAVRAGRHGEDEGAADRRPGGRAQAAGRQGHLLRHRLPARTYYKCIGDPYSVRVSRIRVLHLKTHRDVTCPPVRTSLRRHTRSTVYSAPGVVYGCRSPYTTWHGLSLTPHGPMTRHSVM